MNDLCVQWTKATALKEEANSDYKEGKTEIAIKKVSGAIELHPTNKILYSNRILMYLKTKNYELALADCQIIRELDPKSMYIKGHYLRGLTLLNLKKYKNAAAAFQTVVKLNPSFNKATDRLNECLAELEKENVVNEKRRSSQQQVLKETFGAAQNAEVVTEQKVESEKNEKSEEVVVNKEENVEQKTEEVENVQVVEDETVKSEVKTEEVVKEKVDSIQDEPVKVVEENVKSEESVNKEEAPKDEQVQKENESVNDDQKQLNAEAQSFEPKKVEPAVAVQESDM